MRRPAFRTSLVPSRPLDITGYRVIELGPRHANSISQNHHVGGYGFVWDPEGGRQETSKGWYFVNDSGEHAGSFAPAEYADALSDDRWIVGSATRRGENWAVVLVPTFD